MKEYYSNCAIMIAANFARSDQEGFLAPKKSLGAAVFVPLKSSRVQTGSHFYVTPRIQSLKGLLKHCPPSKRGWTLQEHILSPRVIHFGSDQIHWECRGANASESVDAWQPWTESSKLKHYTSVIYQKESVLHHYNPNDWGINSWGFNAWRDLVGEYMSLSLTVAEDILPAISGIARDFAD
jgi:hypothetical protein